MVLTTCQKTLWTLQRSMGLPMSRVGHFTHKPMETAERAVQTVKRLFGECSDPHLALLAYPWNKGIAPHNFLRNEICVRRYPYIPASWNRVWVHQNVLTRRTLNSSRGIKRTMIHVIEFKTCLTWPPVTKFTFQKWRQPPLFKESSVKGVTSCQRLMVRYAGTKDISTRCPKKWKQSHNLHHSPGWRL